ncbi:transposase [Nonomuraea sp. NPDC003201]
MGRGDVTNAEWERLRPLLPEGGQRGRRWNDQRTTIDGVLYRARTGLSWRDLPERFGPWVTVYKRHRRWSMLLTAIQAEQDTEGRVDWDIAVDSTTVRAHQRAPTATERLKTWAGWEELSAAAH